MLENNRPDSLPVQALFDPAATGYERVLVVAEAPNGDDTFKHGHLTYNPKTDPTGRFAHELLFQVAALDRADVLFTNAALCLPRRARDRHPVSAKQLGNCAFHLKGLVLGLDARVVVTFGTKALRAAQLLDDKGLRLKAAAGKLHDWFDRKLLPLYHPGLLCRNSTRREADQRKDVMPLRGLLPPRPPLLKP